MLKRYKKFYKYHLLFLVAALPLNYYELFYNTKDALIKFGWSLLLLQSWNPDDTVWMGYNGVAWFLSTSLFLTACTPFLYKAISFVPSYRRVRNDIIGIMLCFTAMLICAKINTFHEKYWLYAFPPIRLLDYIAGYLLADIYKVKRSGNDCENNFKDNINGIVVVVFYIIYLAIFNFIDVRFRRAAIYLPGALLTVWVVVKGHGFLQRFLCNRWMVKAGNTTLYFMMCHQIVLKYTALIMEKIIVVNKGLAWFAVIFCLAVVIISAPIYERTVDDIIYIIKKRYGEKLEKL